MVKAVFVDGVGQQLEMVLEKAVTHFHFPVLRQLSCSLAFEEPRRPIEHEASTFERIGRLSDTRVIYGQVEANLKLWVLDLDVTDEAQFYCQHDIADFQLQGWLNRCGQPAMCFIHEKTRDDGQRLTKHHFEGVGRER